MLKKRKNSSDYPALILVTLCLSICSVIPAYAGELPPSVTHPSCITCKGSLSSQGRWCNNHDGTVTDMTTGLVWLFDASWGGMYPMWRESAQDTAYDRATLVGPGNPASLTDGSVRGDWSLPTINQLKSLVTGTEAISLSNTYFFEGVQDNAYWSNTAYNGSIVWILSLDDGNIHPNYKWVNAYVWPVRQIK
ncbi:MAG: DUF1566 domain-containing protein [Deltaproteobacteria bacterium]|nr:DUF1566 domain-containing protein [Deltaproteobacteria bacterium]